jgi:hypothetical protein
MQLNLRENPCYVESKFRIKCHLQIRFNYIKQNCFKNRTVKFVTYLSLNSDRKDTIFVQVSQPTVFV